MKENNILHAVLNTSDTHENKGYIVSGLFETMSEFLERWFGFSENANITGGYKNNHHYIYCYDEPLFLEQKELSCDLVVSEGDIKVYIYSIEIGN